LDDNILSWRCKRTAIFLNYLLVFAYAPHAFPEVWSTQRRFQRCQQHRYTYLKFYFDIGRMCFKRITVTHAEIRILIRNDYLRNITDPTICQWLVRSISRYDLEWRE